MDHQNATPLPPPPPRSLSDTDAITTSPNLNIDGYYYNNNNIHLPAALPTNSAITTATTSTTTTISTPVITVNIADHTPIKMNHLKVAVDLDSNYYRTYLDDQEALNWHRPHTKMLVGTTTTAATASGNAGAAQQCNKIPLKLVGGQLRRTRRSGATTATANDVGSSSADVVDQSVSLIDVDNQSELMLVEYIEQQPPLLINVGMATVIERQHNNGSTHNNSSSANNVKCTGIAPEFSQQAAMDITMMRSPMFQAQLFQQQQHSETRDTDFLLTCRRSADGELECFVRELPQVFTAGHSQPLVAVPEPNSKPAYTFVKNRLQREMYKKLRENPEGLRLIDLRQAFPDTPDSSLRKRLKEIATFSREQSKDASSSSSSSSPSPGYWVLREGHKLPTEEELRAMVTPEMVCLYESMLNGQLRLEDMGVTRSAIAVASCASSKVRNFVPEGIKRAAQLVEQENMRSPWNATSNFINATTGSADAHLKHIAVVNENLTEEEIAEWSQHIDNASASLPNATANTSANNARKQSARAARFKEVLEMVYDIEAIKLSKGEPYYNSTEDDDDDDAAEATRVPEKESDNQDDVATVTAGKVRLITTTTNADGSKSEDVKIITDPILVEYYKNRKSAAIAEGLPNGHEVSNINSNNGTNDHELKSCHSKKEIRRLQNDIRALKKLKERGGSLALQRRQRRSLLLQQRARSSSSGSQGKRTAGVSRYGSDDEGDDSGSEYASTEPSDEDEDAELEKDTNSTTSTGHQQQQQQQHQQQRTAPVSAIITESSSSSSNNNDDNSNSNEEEPLDVLTYQRTSWKIRSSYSRGCSSLLLSIIQNNKQQAEQQKKEEDRNTITNATKKRKPEDAGAANKLEKLPSKRKRMSPEKLAKELSEIIELLMENECSVPFREPVDIKLFKDYRHVIMRPMDLSTMLKSVADYAAVAPFVDDIRLIVNNAHRYCNGRYPEVPPMADKMLRICLDELQKRDLPLTDNDDDDDDHDDDSNSNSTHHMEEAEYDDDDDDDGYDSSICKYYRDDSSDEENRRLEDERDAQIRREIEAEDPYNNRPRRFQYSSSYNRFFLDWGQPTVVVQQQQHHHHHQQQEKPSSKKKSSSNKKSICATTVFKSNNNSHSHTNSSAVGNSHSKSSAHHQHYKSATTHAQSKSSTATTTTNGGSLATSAARRAKGSAAEKVIRHHHDSATEEGEDEEYSTSTTTTTNKAGRGGGGGASGYQTPEEEERANHDHHYHHHYHHHHSNANGNGNSGAGSDKDDDGGIDYTQMPTVKLREELRARSQPVYGTKKELIKRLKKAIRHQEGGRSSSSSSSRSPSPSPSLTSSPVLSSSSSSSPPPPPPPPQRTPTPLSLRLTAHNNNNNNGSSSSNNRDFMGNLVLANSSSVLRRARLSNNSANLLFEEALLASASSASPYAPSALSSFASSSRTNIPNNHANNSDDTESISITSSSSSSTTATHAMRTNGNKDNKNKNSDDDTDSSEDEPSHPMESVLFQKTTEILRKELKRYNRPIYGDKKTLVRRLRIAMEEKGHSPTTAPTTTSSDTPAAITTDANNGVDDLKSINNNNNNKKQQQQQQQKRRTTFSDRNRKRRSNSRKRTRYDYYDDADDGEDDAEEEEDEPPEEDEEMHVITTNFAHNNSTYDDEGGEKWND